MRLTALANPLDKFSIGISDAIDKMMIDRLSENDALVTRYMNEPDFKKIIFDGLAEEIFNQITSTPEPTPAPA